MLDNKNIPLCLIPKTPHYELMDYTQLQYIRATSLFITQRIDGKGDYKLQVKSPKAGCFVKVNNRAKIILGDEFDLRIFRGQNKPYPLIPSFQRLDEVHRCVAYIKREEFKAFFKLTPYFQILSKMSILGIYFEFDLDAIAQHYGFATNYLDITTNEQIALFFAYTYYKNGKYYPIVDFKGYKPTLYTTLSLMFYNNSKSLVPAGFQAVLRPQNQKAMAIDITSIQNNSTCSLFSKTYLPKDPKKAQEIYELFDGGKDLFPKGELISIIEQKIKGNKMLNETLFLRYCADCFAKIKKLLKRD